MKTKLWAIILMTLCTLLTSSAQILYKEGTNRFTSFEQLNIVVISLILIGLFLYGIGAILMVISFRGGDVSVLYPIIATSYIWVTILSAYFFNETINAYRWIGIFTIIIGIIFITNAKTTKFVEPI